MLAFLLLSAIDGTPIPEREIADAVEYAADRLPFTPESSLVWSNRHRSVTVLAWQALTANAGLGSHWHVDRDGGLTLFAGHCWPRVTGWDFGSGGSWAAQLSGWLDRNPVATAHEHLYGQYALLHLDPVGSGMAATDLLGGGVLFTGENERWFGLSNRAELVAAAVGAFRSEPERDPLAMGWLVFWDSSLGDDSGYWDATRLPFNGQIVFGPGGTARIEERPQPFWHRPGPNPTSGDYVTLLEEIDADLRAELRTICRLPVEDFEFQLSAGKDSRLLATLLHDEGLVDRFHFVSHGVPGQADIVGAEMVAARLGLNWRFENRSAYPADREVRRLHRHTFLVEAGVTGWDSVGSTDPVTGVNLQGLGGECTIFGRTSRAGLYLTSLDEVKALYDTKDNFDEFKLLTPEARAYFHRVVHDWVDSEAAIGTEPGRITSLFITEQRTRCWGGPSLAARARLSLAPYLIPSYIRFRQLLPPEDRANPRVHLDMLRRCRVDVSDIPLAGETWPEGAIERYPDADRLRAIEPLRNTPDARRGWRMRLFDELRPVFASYLDEPSDPIFEVVDYGAIQRLMSRPTINGPQLRNLYGAVTGAIWLSGQELPVRLNQPWED